MSAATTVATTEPISADSSLMEGDSFRMSVLFLVGLTIVQRVIGLVRNVLFCGMLEDHELGQWSIASNFLGWAAPFVVLGLPGSFGRLSEHYRHRGQLRVFLRRTSLTCGFLVVVAMAIHLLMPSAIATLVFNDLRYTPLVATVAVVLAAVIAMNFLSEFLTSVRLTRAVSLMHLANSVVFTVLGILFITTGLQPAQSLLIAFGSSALVAAAIGMTYVVRLWRALPAVTTAEESTEFWKRLVPLATWIWCGNTIANLFDISDQFVLKHFSQLPASTVDAMVGQLYASRVFPVLIVTVAVMIGSSLLPFLIKNWEAGRTGEVRRHMNAVIKYTAVGFTLVAALTHVASPILFTWILRGKYDSGLHLMSWAFVQYTWFGLSAIAGKYLICTDRARAGLLPLLLGLVSSVTLTIALAPQFGLVGVVWATTAANGLAFISLLLVSTLYGMRWDRGAWLAACLPLSLALGGAASLGILAAVLAANLRGQWLLTEDERQQLATAGRKFFNRLKPPRNWQPTANT